MGQFANQSEQTEFGDSYSLIWTTSLSGVVGEVRNFAVDTSCYRRIKIIAEKDLRRKTGFRYCCLKYEQTEPEIVVDRSLLGLPVAIRNAMIWHEVGHVHHEHVINSLARSPESIRADRLAAISSGGVDSQELEADQFAVKQVGTEAVILFLKFLLESRANEKPSNLNSAACIELERRILLLEKGAGCPRVDPHANPA